MPCWWSGNGDLFAIYDPDGDYEQRPRQGWATIVNSDFNDTASDLDRVLNPETTWPEVRQLLDDAHAFAVRKDDNATRRREQRA